jgi:endonuclease YncB( thermonuclease family)
MKARPKVRRAGRLDGISWVTVLVLYAVTSSADILVGRVVGLTDGDTITFLDDDKAQHKIRLSGMAAREK